MAHTNDPGPEQNVQLRRLHVKRKNLVKQTDIHKDRFKIETPNLDIQISKNRGE